MAKTMEHLSDFAFVKMYNFTLACRDSYLAHMKSGIKKDTLPALHQAPMAHLISRQHNEESRRRHFQV